HHLAYISSTLFTKKVSKERKEEGKNHQDEERKLIQTAQERVGLSFLIFNSRLMLIGFSKNLPKRYLKIINCIQAHIDGEFFPQKAVYIVKKLPFQSKTATLFFKRLDNVMRQSAIDDGKRIQGQQRIRHPDAPVTLFPKAPKGLPLDFYNSK
ncbi:hypothetical protein VP01_13273g1, partial [Puccinia sorghi]